jgi:hypothetical protein
MIKTFVLFWFVIAGNTGSPATGSQEFLSKETCLAAKAEMDKKEKRGVRNDYDECIVFLY